MSVIVKGMEMPPSCYLCGLTDTSFIHCEAFSRRKLLEDDCEERRPNWCPLVELPEKHGRLIDADELWNKMSKYTDNEGAKFPYGDDDSMIHRDSACFMIESAYTILKAEGVEE